MRRLSLLLLILALATPRLAAQFDYGSFPTIDNIYLVGAASLAGNIIRLTYPEKDRIGGVWHAAKQRVAGGFSTTFRFQMSEKGGTLDPDGQNGGDGFAFVIQNVSPIVLGGYGMNIGYGGAGLQRGIGNCLAVEFDTYRNTATEVGDPDNHHVTIQPTTPLHSASLGSAPIPDPSDGKVHVGRIDYSPGIITVTLDGVEVLRASLRLEQHVSLDADSAWIGFTAATGTAWENHDILTWSFTPVGSTPPRPRLAPSGTYTLCAGDSLWIDAGPGYQSYQWNNGMQGQRIRIGADGRYFVIVRDAAGATTTSDTLLVVTRPAPVASIVADGPTEFCQPGSVRLSASPGMTSYRWSNGETTPSIVVSTSGSYSVTVTDPFGCSASSPAVTITTHPSPKPTITARTLPGSCGADSVVLEASAGFASYRWSTGESTRSILAPTTGSYFVEGTTDRGCAATSDPISVTVRPGSVRQPVVTPLGSTTICGGGSVRLRASNGYRSYRWSNGLTDQEIVVLVPGAFTVTAVDSNGCSSTSSAVTITFLPSPQPTVEPIPSICFGQSAVLRASKGYLSYRWSNGSTADTTIVTSPGSYQLTVSDSAGCTGSVAVEVKSSGDVPLQLMHAAAICLGDSVRLEASGADTYRWIESEGLSCTDCPDPIARPTRSITYHLVATSSSGCIRLDSVRVTVDSASRVLRTLAGTITVRPGLPASMPVSILDDATPVGARSLVVTVRSSAGPLLIDGISTAGRLLAGWMITPLGGDGRRYSARLTAPGTASLVGAGVLFDVQLTPFLGGAPEIPIEVELAFEDKPCSSILPTSALVRLDSICGLSFRLIELSSTKYSLGPITPNPSRGRVEIPFSLGLDGATRLEIFDMTGQRVAILSDQYLAPGSYAAGLDGSLAAGAYLVRLSSGDWSETVRLIVQE